MRFNGATVGSEGLASESVTPSRRTKRSEGDHWIFAPYFLTVMQKTAGIPPVDAAAGTDSTVMVRRSRGRDRTAVSCRSG